MLTVLIALVVVAVGCNGGGSSSSSGGSSVEMSKVQGNVRSANVAWMDSAGGTRTASSELLLSVLNQAISPAQAAIDGIEVCIATTCTFTDQDGFFTLDISGIDTGMYALTFEVGGVRYTMPLTQEISSTSIVIVTDVSILDSGEVTASEVSYQDAGVSDDGGIVSGGVISAPEDEDTDSGDGQPKVVICHKPDTPAEHTLTVAEPAVPAHLNHGDYLGACIHDDDDVNDDDEVIDEGDDSPVDD